MTKAKAVKDEERALNSTIKPLDWAELAGGASILVYEHRSQVTNLGILCSVRYTVHGADGGGCSGILSTRWQK